MYDEDNFYLDEGSLEGWIDHKVEAGVTTTNQTTKSL